MNFVMAVTVLGTALMAPYSTSHGVEYAYSIVHIQPANLQQDAIVQRHCAGTLLRAGVVLTAKHCFESTPEKVAILCSNKNTDGSGSQRVVDIDRVDNHPESDLVLLALKSDFACQNNSPSLRIHNDAQRPLVSFKQPDNSLFYLMRLNDNTSTIFVKDATACLRPGHSGYPVFSVSNSGQLQLSAMLISGTDDCPATQVLLRLYPLRSWIHTSME